MKIKRCEIAVLLIVSVLLLTACGNYATSNGYEEGNGNYNDKDGSFENAASVENKMDLVPTHIEPFYIYQDKDSLLWGIFNKDTDQIVMEPTLTEIGDFNDDGIAPAKKGEYWGYINTSGNVVIDFFFDRAYEFQHTTQGDYAKVYCKGAGHGVIDRNGAYVIAPKYDDFRFYLNYIIATEGSTYPITNNYYGYDYSGKLIASKAYDGSRYGEIKEYGGWLYAQPKGKNNQFELYDYTGKRITGVGDWENIRYVSYPKNGVHILYYGQKDSWGYTNAGMRIADENFNLISKEYYDSLSTFNELGFAVAENETKGWHIINKEGRALQSLPIHEIYGVQVDYAYANEYMACCLAKSGMIDTYYGVVDLQTGEMTTWESVKPVDGTNCIIVTDIDTGLKGLYDKNSMVLDCIYQDITYNGTLFEITRGGTFDIYFSSK